MGVFSVARGFSTFSDKLLSAPLWFLFPIDPALYELVFFYATTQPTMEAPRNVRRACSSVCSAANLDGENDLTIIIDNSTAG